MEEGRSVMDIRFTNRWAGFSREEIMLFHQGIKWFTEGKCEDFKELMDEMWSEIIRRDDYLEGQLSGM